MNYGYEDCDLSDLIQKYEIVDNKIVIKFLDGSSSDMPLTKQNEQDLLKQMLWQAYFRNESSALDVANKKRKDNLRWMATETGFTFLALLSAGFAKQDWLKISASVLGGLTGGMALSWVSSYKQANEVVQELKKYDIYLSMVKQLEKSNSPEVFSGIKNPNGSLNINTLDNYSLKDIKKIRRNLETLQQSTSKNSKKQFVKRISK